MKYPKLEPVPIHTKGLSFFMKIWVWLFSVRKWKVVEDWEFDTTLDNRSITVFIHKGFVFDGASIPRPLWWLLSPIGVLLIPGLVHDYVYRYRYITFIDKKTRIKNRIYNSDHKYWDLLFRDVSVQINECNVISYGAWIALLVFGKSAWKKNRKIEQKRIEENWRKLNDIKYTKEDI